MNKVLVVAVTEDARGTVTLGGIEQETEQGIREALAMVDFARDRLTEGLVQLRVRERAMAKQEKGENDDEG